MSIDARLIPSGSIEGYLHYIDMLAGKDAYQIAVENGFEGSEKEWLESLKGESAYNLAVDQGYNGTLEDWLNSLVGADGKSAYKIAIEKGYSGTEEEWLKSLKGDTPVKGIDYFTNEDRAEFTTIIESDLQSSIDKKSDKNHTHVIADLTDYSPYDDSEIRKIISDESTNRMSNDNSLTELINTEVQDRITADNELSEKISAIPKFTIEVVDSLPTSNISVSTVYLLKTSDVETSNLYTEYIYINNAWEKLGTQTLDLSGYYQKTEVDSLLNNKQNILVAGDNVSINGNIISATDTVYDDTEIKQLITNETSSRKKADSEKQDKLTAGVGISLTDDGIISCTAEGGEYIVDISTGDTFTPSESPSVELSADVVKQIREYVDKGGNFTLRINERYYFNFNERNGSELNFDCILNNEAPSGYPALVVASFTLPNENIATTMQTSWQWYETAEVINSLLSEKQNKLTAGDGISLAEDGAISCSVENIVTLNFTDKDTGGESKRELTAETVDKIRELFNKGNLFGIKETGNSSPIYRYVQSSVNANLLYMQFCSIRNARENCLAFEMPQDTGSTAIIESSAKDYGTYDDLNILNNIKQDKLTAGVNITIDGTTISAASYDDTEVKSLISSESSARETAVKEVIDSVTALQTTVEGKQDTLTAGTGISIVDGVISCTFEDGSEVSY